MNKSDSIGALAKALAKVQSQLQPAVKDAKNPFFKSNYATLNSVWDACRALLTANGLAVAQLSQATEAGVIIETVLMHESGEWISGEMLLPMTKVDPQGVGSAMSYGRRYGLASMVGVVSDEDDDGNAASGNGNNANRPASNRPAPPPAKPTSATRRPTLAAVPPATPDTREAQVARILGFVAELKKQGAQYRSKDGKFYDWTPPFLDTLLNKKFRIARQEGLAACGPESLTWTETYLQGELEKEVLCTNIRKLVTATGMRPADFDMTIAAGHDNRALEELTHQELSAVIDSLAARRGAA